MLNVYIYDGTFDGLLTSVFDAWTDRDFSDIRTDKENTNVSLIESTVRVTTDGEKADRISRWITKTTGQESLQKVYRVYLTERADRGRIIFNYLKLIAKTGSRTDARLTHPDVLVINNADRLFTRETSKLQGFLRFEVLESDILYAQFTPEFNQLEILAPFFADRYSGNPWIIHDTKRNTAAIFDGSRFIITEADGNLPHGMTGSETDYRKMWKEYLVSLTIKERINLKLQQQHVPLKYRKNMTEFMHIN